MISIYWRLHNRLRRKRMACPTCGSHDPRYAYYDDTGEFVCDDPFHAEDPTPLEEEGEHDSHSPVQLILLAIAGLAIFAFFTWCGYEMAVR